MPHTSSCILTHKILLEPQYTAAIDRQLCSQCGATPAKAPGHHKKQAGMLKMTPENIPAAGAAQHGGSPHQQQVGKGTYASAAAKLGQYAHDQGSARSRHQAQTSSAVIKHPEMVLLRSLPSVHNMYLIRWRQRPRGTQ